MDELDTSKMLDKIDTFDKSSDFKSIHKINAAP